MQVGVRPEVYVGGKVYIETTTSCRGIVEGMDVVARRGRSRSFENERRIDSWTDTGSKFQHDARGLERPIEGERNVPRVQSTISR